MRADLDSGLDAPNSLNFCRFVLASAVILSHAYALLGPTVLRLEPMVRLSGRLGLGTLAVDLFFVLSGFLVSASYCRQPDTRAYLRKRALRIYPGLICALVLSAFVVAPLGGAQASLGDFLSFIYRPVLLQSLPNIPGAFATNPLQYVNGSLWTIRFEMFCYLLVPLMAWLGCYHRPKRAGLAFLLAYLGYQISRGWHLSFGPWDQLDELPQFVCYFMAGAACYALRHHLPRSPKLIGLAALIAGLTLRRSIIYWTLPFCASYLILCLALSPSRFSDWGNGNDLSYGIYLYGFAIQQLLIHLDPQFWSPTSLFAVSWILSLAAGWLSWRLVERPFLLRKRPE